MDRRSAAGSHRAARSAFAGRYRCHDHAGLPCPGVRASLRQHSSDVPSASAGRDFDRTHWLSGHADATDRGCAEDLDGAWRMRRPRRHQKAGHGDKSAAMSLVAQDLRARCGLLAVTTGWSRLSAPEGLFSAEELRHGIHGGAVETSIMLARYPQHVRKDKIADFSPASIAMEKDYRWLSAHRPAPFAWQAQDLHPSGAAGDATAASAEKGERLLDHGARAFCELLADVDKFDPDTLSSRPKA